MGRTNLMSLRRFKVLEPDVNNYGHYRRPPEGTRVFLDIPGANNNRKSKGKNWTFDEKMEFQEYVISNGALVSPGTKRPVPLNTTIDYWCYDAVPKSWTPPNGIAFCALNSKGEPQGSSGASGPYRYPLQTAWNKVGNKYYLILPGQRVLKLRCFDLTKFRLRKFDELEDEKIREKEAKDAVVAKTMADDRQVTEALLESMQIHLDLKFHEPPKWYDPCKSGGTLRKWPATQFLNSRFEIYQFDRTESWSTKKSYWHKEYSPGRSITPRRVRGVLPIPGYRGKWVAKNSPPSEIVVLWVRASEDKGLALLGFPTLDRISKFPFQKGNLTKLTQSVLGVGSNYISIDERSTKPYSRSLPNYASSKTAMKGESSFSIDPRHDPSIIILGCLDKPQANPRVADGGARFAHEIGHCLLAEGHFGTETFSLKKRQYEMLLKRRILRDLGFVSRHRWSINRRDVKSMYKSLLPKGSHSPVTGNLMYKSGGTKLNALQVALMRKHPLLRWPALTKKTLKYAEDAWVDIQGALPPRRQKLNEK
jgi:hypothetical protein